MDLSSPNRGPQPHQQVPNGPSQNSFVPTNNRKTKDAWHQTRVYRISQAILTVCVVIVLIGLLGFIAFGNGSAKSESKYIQDSKLQAVFLNTGQVYFGNIKTLNNNFLVLDNIFYLQTANSGSSASSSASSSANTSVSLVKLGCELHAPLDQMIINRSQVTFWENLSPSGQVAKAVATFEKANPNGQKCSDQSTAGTSGQSTPQAATESSSTPSTATKP